MESEQGTVSVRRATTSDSALLLAWRNDPMTRQMFVHQKEVALEEHIAWLNQTLNRQDHLLLIGESFAGRPIGVVRFDIDQSSLSAEISITIAPEMRGLGFATKLLRLAIEYLVSESNLQISHVRLVARIRRGNAASVACFQRVGFLVDNEDLEYVYLTLHCRG